MVGSIRGGNHTGGATLASVCTRFENRLSGVSRVRSGARYPMPPMTTSRLRENTVPK